jgi:hypothetical protein
MWLYKGLGLKNIPGKLGQSVRTQSVRLQARGLQQHHGPGIRAAANPQFYCKRATQGRLTDRCIDGDVMRLTLSLTVD